MINIYGPHEIAAKSSLWSRMSDFIQTHEGHFIIFGDMNEVRDESERYGAIFSRTEAQTFNSFIDDAGFIDLPLGGRSYTWMNKAGTKMSKLDRFRVSNSVMDAFSDLKATALARGWFDHIPLMLHSEKVDYGHVPFKIFHSWMQRDGFEEVIKTAYEECSQGYSNQCLTFHEKLKFIKQKIKAWGHNVRRGDVSRYQEVKLRLIEIEEKIDKREMDTFQKERVKWDVEGDENSKNFHGILKQKRNQQMVKGIMINGEWVINPQQVKMAFLNFYKEKFDDHVSRMIFSPVTPQPRLNEAECGALESRVTMDEIRTAVWDCGSQKAPGPYGFSFLFIKKYWEILKHEIETSVVFFKVQRFFILHNIAKSNVYGIGVSSDDIIDMARVTGCASGTVPFIYLGLPIASNMNLIANWQSLIDPFRGKLSSSKANLLSIGGRLTLIKSVLGSIGIYYMSIFKCPESVLKTLEYIRASFFWGSCGEQKKMAWVKWSHVMASLDKGGLSVGSLKVFNLALLQKWRWRLVNNPDVLWACVIKAIHG
nr:RNA-directed DNA polymerase, eukaryota, reverse transcriptase zinc-binding domain protein [Tanacetum cinerariifolium]